MKTSFGFALIFVVYGILSGCSCLTCWKGFSGQRLVKVRCDGWSCAQTKGPNGTLCSCWYGQTFPDGCRKIIGTRICFCNENLCNNGEILNTVLKSNNILESSIMPNKNTNSAFMPNSASESGIMTNNILESDAGLHATITVESRL